MIFRIDVNGLPVAVNCLLELTYLIEGKPQVEVCLCIFEVDVDGLLVVGDGLRVPTCIVVSISLLEILLGSELLCRWW